MKKLLFITLLTFTGFTIKAKAQNQTDKIDSIPKSNGEYGYEEVVKVDTNLKKDDLYKRSKLFFTDQFTSSKDVIQYDDRGEGKVIGKGNFRSSENSKIFIANFTITLRIDFSFEVVCKDGRYRYRIYNIECYQNVANLASDDPAGASSEPTVENLYLQTRKGANKKAVKLLLHDTVIKFDLLILELKKYMNNSNIEAKNDF